MFTRDELNCLYSATLNYLGPFHGLEDLTERDIEHHEKMLQIADKLNARFLELLQDMGERNQ